MVTMKWTTKIYTNMSIFLGLQILEHFVVSSARTVPNMNPNIQRFFLRFHAQRYGFLNGYRPFICLYGFHLKMSFWWCVVECSQIGCKQWYVPTRNRCTLKWDFSLLGLFSRIFDGIYRGTKKEAYNLYECN